MRPVTWLLNSAVIAAGAYGEYRYSPSTVEELREALKKPFVSRIGYPATARAIERWTGVLPEISRDNSVLMPGDRAYIVRLTYRVNPSAKSRTDPRDDDFEIATIERIS